MEVSAHMLNKAKNYIEFISIVILVLKIFHGNKTKVLKRLNEKSTKSNGYRIFLYILLLVFILLTIYAKPDSDDILLESGFCYYCIIADIVYVT